MEKEENKMVVEECGQELFAKLPIEVLTTNILSRLNFKSVAQGSCVSKQWHRILSDSDFLQIQITNISKIDSDILVYYGTKTEKLAYYIEDNEQTFSGNPIKPFKLFDYAFIRNSFGRDYKILGSCIGFLWLSGHYNTTPEALQSTIERVSVFLHGRHHWLTVDERSLTDGPLIVSFDLGVEDFGSVPTPDSHLFKYSFECYYVGVLEGNLSAVECSSESYIHVWVMKKYNIKESWVKQFSIEHDSLCRKGLDCLYVELIKLCTNGELLLLCNSNYLVSYNIKSRKSRFLLVEGFPERSGCYLEAHPLVGNLISVKLARGMDCGTKRSTSEKKKEMSLTN
ncbi:hypothetical protein IFM89_034181 [Coptis chinensis]|uniref:F-box domain-containing protein n=1 Tax=Coptis chinensis TaxID=261450 RepID=A0A835IG12_9MAGN|nr:hypothetical protein IFM89_034181 [Coptis chinensis]